GPQPLHRVEPPLHDGLARARHGAPDARRPCVRGARPRPGPPRQPGLSRSLEPAGLRAPRPRGPGSGPEGLPGIREGARPRPHPRRDGAPCGTGARPGGGGIIAFFPTGSSPDGVPDLAMAAALWVLLALQSDADAFESKVRPLLAERCYSCHSTAAGKRKGGLALDSRDAVLKRGDSGPAAVPGAHGRSLLLRAVGYGDDLKMPPKGKLSRAETAALADWVRRGLPWPASGPAASAPGAPPPPADVPWSFRPVRDPAVPAVRDRGWPADDLDRFILSKLEERGYAPAPPAGKAELLRRVTFDLTGLPPTPEELDAFAGDRSLAAFEKVVDRLLASPRFGERWGRHWMDVVRYADSTGFGADYTLDEAWRYRDYIIDSF